MTLLDLLLEWPGVRIQLEQPDQFRVRCSVVFEGQYISLTWSELEQRCDPTLVPILLKQLDKQIEYSKWPSKAPTRRKHANR